MSGVFGHKADPSSLPFAVLFRQIAVLLRKNAILYKRRTYSTACQILLPVLFVFAIWGIVHAVNGLDSTYQNIRPFNIDGPLPKCTPWNGAKCYSLVYTPATDPVLASVVNRVLAASSFTADDVLVLPNGTAVYDWIMANPNRTQVAADFSYRPYHQYWDGANSYIPYKIFFNSTSGSATTQASDYASDGSGNSFATNNDGLIDVATHLQAQIERAIVQEVSALTGQHIPTPSISYQGFPQPPQVPNGELIVLTMYGPALFFVAMCICFISVLYSVVDEKEQKLRIGMQTMGLSLSAYWLSWIVTSFCISFLFALLVSIAGLAFQLRFFTNCNFFVLIMCFTSFGVAMCSFGLFLSSLLGRVRSALITGLLFLCLGFILSFFVSNPFIYTALYDPNTRPLYRWLLTFWPSFSFGKSMYDIAILSIPSVDWRTRQVVDAPGYSWSDLTKSNTVSSIKLPSTLEGLGLLWMDSAVYVLLAIYLDQILGFAGGARQAPWFFLTPSFWSSIFCVSSQTQKEKNSPQRVLPKYNHNHAAHSGITDPDVLRERQSALAMEGNDEEIVRIVQMKKSYSSGLFSSAGKVKALQDVSLVIPRGSCFALLGHNGAGKSTLISILTGIAEQSSGEAFIFGKNIRTEMADIQQYAAVCPQHDILWQELTAAEHLDFFARLKGLNESQRKYEVEERLKDVGLYKVRNKPVGQFSGGMKRRCSFAIATIGNPQVVYLDEPTTGLDPHNRREIWKMIERLKGGRVVFLTTHSMEEADALADRIGIMAYGMLRTIGESMELKKKHGNGYNVQLVSDFPLNAKQLVGSLLPMARLTFENSGSLIFNLPDAAVQSIPPFLEAVEAHIQSNQGLVKDAAVSHTTMEEVYLHVTEQSNFKYATIATYQQQPPQPQQMPVNPPIGLQIQASAPPLSAMQASLLS